MVHRVVASTKKAESESKALSVHYLTTDFLLLLDSEGLGKRSTINEIEEKVIRGKSSETLCPRDSSLGSAFVDAVEGEENVGPATHMLSYTWKYAIGDIADSLEHWSGASCLNPRQLYIWMCWACVNQHRVQEMRRKGEVVPFEEFKEIFEGRVKSIGKIVALMMPWHAPAYLERSWCMLELHTAIQLGTACELTILMPPKEEEQWTMSLMNGAGFEQIYTTLREASISSARASVPADQENILRLVDSGQGRHLFDAQMKRHLQSWFLHSASKHVQELPLKMLKACSQVGKLLSDFSSLDEAASILDFGLSTKTSLITWHAQSQQSRDEMAVDVGNIWHERGWIEHKRGLHQSATDLYTKGLDELRQLGASDSIAGCKLLRARARALVRDEPDEFFSDYCPPATDLEKALRELQAALEILEGHGLQDTEEGAKTYNNLGLVHSLRSDFAVSAKMFEAAGRIRKKTGTLKMPMNARRLYNFGSMRLKQGRIAREELQEKAVSAKDVSQTATEDSQFFTQAAELLQKAVDILEKYEFKDDLVALCEKKLAWLAQAMSQADLPRKETRLVSL